LVHKFLMIILGFLFVFVVALFYFNGKGVPVFLYHQVNEFSNIDRHLLEKHFQYIRHCKLQTFTISEAQDIVMRKGKMPDRSLLITFDDGYYDNYLHVFPLLKAYNMKATIFLNTAFIKEKVQNRTATRILPSSLANTEAMENLYRTGSAESEQYLTWEEIEEMHKSGLCDFQAHTHTHKVAFSSYKLRKIIEGNNFGREEIGLYEGKVMEGTPVINSRGETSVTTIHLNESFLNDFRKYYFQKLKFLNKRKRLRKGNNFIKNYTSAIGKIESLEEKEIRIRKEIKLNKELIESHLNNKVFAFAWPYGHCKSGIEIIKKENISTFVTCKKGTNNPALNFEKIRRIELRKPSLNKFKWTVIANMNLLSGKIYGIFT
jgi:hypothetical protein